MKKFIVTFLAIFYIGASSGATVHVHYCMGKLIDWGLSDSEANDCSNCGMEKSKSEDCCKDEHHKLTLKDSPKPSPVVYEFNSPGIGIPSVVAFSYAPLAVEIVVEKQVLTESALRTQATPAFIRNCNFRI